MKNKVVRIRHVELYGEGDLAAARRKAAFWRAAAVIIAAAGLGVCIWFCTKATPYVYLEWLKKTVIVSAVTGWAVITIRIFPLEKHKAAARHIESVTTGQRETVEGSFEVTDERTSIKRGVSMYRIKVEGDPEVASLQVYEAKAGLLRGENPVRIESVHGFAVAYEVEYEDV